MWPWPEWNASLNLVSGILLVLAYRSIKNGEREQHKQRMLAAAVVSGLFLVSYLIYHAQAGSRTFPDLGWIRITYLAILLSHTIMAVVNVPLVILTLVRGLKGSFIQHKAVARWTFPVWLYVSITGVLIYLLLYRLAPALTDGGAAG